MGAQAAIEGLARCVKSWPTIGPVVQVHDRRRIPSSTEFSAICAFDDGVASWQADYNNSYALGLRVDVYCPAVDHEASQKKLATLIDEIAAFRQTMRGQSLDETDGVLSAQWGPLVLTDVKVNNTAMVEASMNIVAIIQQDY